MLRFSHPWGSGQSAPHLLMSIADYPEVLKTIDAILSKKGTAEIKLEGRDSTLRVVVVETSRQVKNMTPVNN